MRIVILCLFGTLARIATTTRAQSADSLELSDRAHGSLGLWVGEGSRGHFANLRVTRGK